MNSELLEFVEKATRAVEKALASDDPELIEGGKKLQETVNRLVEKVREAERLEEELSRKRRRPVAV